VLALWSLLLAPNKLEVEKARFAAWLSVPKASEEAIRLDPVEVKNGSVHRFAPVAVNEPNLTVPNL